MNSALAERLRTAGIRPSAQRLAVAEYVLATDEHPSADAVLERVRADVPMLSRATVYNTLRLLADRGLLRRLVLSGSRTVFDPRLEPHHHFVNDETGAIEDLPWDAIRVEDPSHLPGYDIREYMVVARGRKA